MRRPAQPPASTPPSTQTQKAPRRTGGLQWQLEKGARPKSGSPKPAGPSVSVPANLRGGEKTILVVDDDPVMRMLLKMALRPPRFDCLVAENGKAAQELVLSKHPDVILLDLLMPVMDGLSFLQWLRQTASDQTPVLVFSNVNDPKITQEAVSMGANGVVFKPLHLNDLMASIQKLVPR